MTHTSPSFLTHPFGLTLGGGAARGYAHIGVLLFLEEHDVVPTEISGTSMGALVGALYASGKNAQEIEQIAIRTNPLFKIAEFGISKYGLFSGEKLDIFLQELFGNLKIEDLKIPLSLNATDLETGEEVVFRKGLVWKAVRASVSVPGVFSPVLHEERILVDGGLVNNLPVHLLREKHSLVIDVRKQLKNELLIRKSITGEKKRGRIPLFIDLLEQSFTIFLAHAGKESLAPTPQKTVIRMHLPEIRYGDFLKTKKIIAMGKKEIEEQLGTCS